ncbi:MAG: UDP-3-O-(3-hydroxymyristoyl)glucosamine N-acyltransferase [Flavobacteriales bacterium]|nr:UDP-3-O-(3-hydroxymyristoyl)glucosamine N-acyltransferase [Flavobacteriales bacterium]NNK80833.1 UDP-3-O-(3-hydroxymyristoyl)glucosamine N-acyltransferase [Flavobacteriales bacterium]
MKFDTPQTLGSLAALIQAEMIGPVDHKVTGINEIHKVESGDLVFVDHPKYYEKALNSKATTILINSKEYTAPEGKALIYSKDPFSDFNKITKHFRPRNFRSEAISEDVEIGKGTQIYPGVQIGKRVSIGEECIIHPGVVLSDDTQIGDRVIIHSNTVIGADAFYYKARPEGREKLHTCGCVVIEDDVEIGALCTIDRGVTGDTRIGAHSKLDCQVHIGHDTVVGKHCLMAAQVGVAGCVVIEDEVTLWGQVGVPSDLTIGKGATILGQSGIMGSVPPGKTYFGSPAKERNQAFLELAHIKKLPELFKKLMGNG